MSGTLKKKREKSGEKKKKQFWSSFRFRGTFSGQLRKSTKEQTVESCSNNDSEATGCICTGYRKTDETKTLPPNDALSTPPDGLTVIKGPRLSEVVPITVNVEPGDRISSVSTFQSHDRNTRTQNQGRRHIERPALDLPSHSVITTNTPGNTRTQQRPLIDFSLFDPNMYPTEDPDQILWDERQQEMKEGVLVQGQSRRPSAGRTRVEVAPTSGRHGAARNTPPRNEVPFVEMIEIDRLEIVLARRMAISATDNTVAVSHQLPDPSGPFAPPDSDQSGGYPLLSNVLSTPIIRINQLPHTDPNAQSRGNYTSVEYPDNSNNPHPPPIPHRVHTQVDYVHCLVPDLHSIHNSGFYWAVMDRYGAEKLLENKPEGTFLLRDSAQEEFLFSVSFRRYGRTLHARIEQWNHKFSFDSHDPGVFATPTVCGLLKHYKDPSCCMFFEPMLTIPLNRKDPFSLQELCRSVVCSHTTYDGVDCLSLPNKLKEYLKYYHYKQKVRVRRFESSSDTEIVWCD